ncbi:hypothetical protein XENTR_v10006793 [Xenopus tropicalis]|uniref:Uncharacterized protein LOC116408707 isoform X1 n=1 Tax=Xenopus tropicalis TaxID=8364 RepID=A0A8J1J6E2_XENTR|nr:uncharacterized protein LOC116408707 isoform X1 [Xenopus tropicalis]KAE8626879.1 hypothetical protein XENTR_v10006793 [Xenopus tropicalis]
MKCRMFFFCWQRCLTCGIIAKYEMDEMKRKIVDQCAAEMDLVPNMEEEVQSSRNLVTRCYTCIALAIFLLSLILGCSCRWCRKQLQKRNDDACAKKEDLGFRKHYCVILNEYETSDEDEEFVDCAEGHSILQQVQHTIIYRSSYHLQGSSQTRPTNADDFHDISSSGTDDPNSDKANYSQTQRSADSDDVNTSQPIGTPTLIQMAEKVVKGIQSLWLKLCRSLSRFGTKFVLYNIMPD